MKDGFIKVAAATPQIEVADCIHNTQEIVKKAKEMSAAGARILVFPELCITGYKMCIRDSFKITLQQCKVILCKEMDEIERKTYNGT